MTTYAIDCGNLCVTDVSIVSGERRSEEDMLASAQTAVRHLYAELLALPTTKKRGRDEGATDVIELPQPVMRLPREKAPPKEKELTPWQKFALKKGINLDRKKERKVWDEDRQEWIDKWGKRRREVERQKDWIREVPANYVPGAVGDDPFLDDRKAKKSRLEKHKASADKNKDRQDKTRREVQHLELAARSLATASAGKFDKARRRK